jgi:predicted ATP-grasp superfamily ATP-dependent carboligase
MTDGRIKGALVLDGNPGALAIVRSLGRRNIPVWALLDKYRVASFSRYCTRAFQWPDAPESEKVEWLMQLGCTHKLNQWVLFSTSDETARLESLNRAPLSSQYCPTSPSWDIMRWAYDKRLTCQLAADVGLNHPQTFFPRDRYEVESLECGFPLVLKPAYKQKLNRFTRSKAWLARDRNELLALYDEAVRLVDPSIVLIQEMIGGGGESQFSFACLCLDGRPLASLTARRTRQYPLDFGRGSFVETLELPEIEAPARRLLSSLHYSGMAELEFKYDSRDGKYKLLEMNPRFWSWHSLGAPAGVDFPYLLWQTANDQRIEEVRARTGLKWIDGVMDLAAAAGDISRGRISVINYLRSLSGISDFAVYSRDDLLPALLEIPSLLCGRAFQFIKHHLRHAELRGTSS